MAQKPDIRFAGFNDDWEQRKLGDISDSYSGGTPTAGKAEYYGGCIPFIRSAEVNSDTTELFLTDEGLKNSSAKMVKKGDILYALYGATSGEVGLARLDGAINQAILDIKPHEGYDAPFLMQWLRKNKESIIGTYLQGGQGNLSGTIVTSLIVDCPNYDEQKIIGKFFANLDNLITLHQRKCDEMKEIKKSMLQKMFPKNREKEPEIRFKGFSDTWTKYKLGDLYTERNERGNNSLQILSVSIHSGVSDGELNEEELGKTVKRSEDKSTYKHVYTGDLIFNMMRAWQGAIGVAKCEGMISPAYISAVPNEKVYPLFMDYALRRSEAIAEINNLSYGIRDFRKRLYWNSFIHVNCMLPSVEEQKKIYKFLRCIDEYISVLQRKCIELKTLKKYLLQNMFCEHE